MCDEPVATAARCPVCCRSAPVAEDYSIRTHMRREPGHSRMVRCAGSGTVLDVGYWSKMKEPT